MTWEEVMVDFQMAYLSCVVRGVAWSLVCGKGEAGGGGGVVYGLVWHGWMGGAFLPLLPPFESWCLPTSLFRVVVPSSSLLSSCSFDVVVPSPHVPLGGGDSSTIPKGRGGREGGANGVTEAGRKKNPIEGKEEAALESMNGHQHENETFVKQM